MSLTQMNDTWASVHESYTWQKLISPEQYDRHFADDIVNCIFMNGKFSILIRI